MLRVENGDRPSPENGNIRVANPADLMRENPAALIVNKESYGRMAAHFSTDQFDPPQVVRVATFSSEHGEVVRDFVLDGMTRTKFVADNRETIARANPGFEFVVRDVTASALQNVTIVPTEERVNGRQTLTMLQYLRAVIPPTVEHSQIAPDRIAAHLINGWDNMVGEELARKYSALAALSLLGNQRINIATDDGLKRDLDRQQRLMAGETIQERANLQRSLLEMAAVIRQTRLNRQEVARSAFMLVGADSPVIGGATEARKQIYGLLYTPEVDRKLEAAFSNISEREQMRDQLGRFISDSFRKIGIARNAEELISVLGMALRDGNLNFGQIIGVFDSPDPIRQYDQVREDMNADKLAKAYKTTQRVQEPNAIEAALIEQLGRKTILVDADIQGLTRSIKAAANVTQRAEEFKLQLTTQRDQLMATGVRSQTIDEALPNIALAQAEITGVRSLEALSRANQRLANAMEETSRRINTQVSIHRVGGMVDQIAGDKLKEGYGPQVRTDIVGLVIGEFRAVNNDNQSQVRQRVRELASLDHELLLKVKDGDIRLVVALQRQRDKNIPAQPALPPVITSAPSTETQSPQPLITPPQGFGRTRFDAGTYAIPPRVEAAIPDSQTSRPEEVVIDQATLDEQRKQNNREKLQRLLQNMSLGLRDIDLEHSDITDAEQRPIDEVVRILGKIGYDHPDVPRIVKAYPKTLEEIQGLRAAQVAKDREEVDRDTRTGR